MYMGIDSVPKDYKSELDAIMQTAVAIHGKKFGEHVKFLVNLKSLLGALLTNTNFKDNVDEEFMKDVMVNISTQLSGSHAELAGLTVEQQKAAFKTVDALDSVVGILETSMEKKKGI